MRYHSKLEERGNTNVSPCILLKGPNNICHEGDGQDKCDYTTSLGEEEIRILSKKGKKWGRSYNEEAILSLKNDKGARLAINDLADFRGKDH